MFVTHILEIVGFERINLSSTTSSVDVKQTSYNVEDLMKSFTFGFKHKGQSVDMIDNEYLRVHFTYEKTFSTEDLNL